VTRAAFLLLAAALLVAAPTLPASAQSLEQAYRTELKVLRSERNQLQKALGETESSSATARRALQAEIEKLTGQLSSLRADNAARAGLRPSPTEEARQVQLTQLLDQIEAAVANRRIAVPDAGASAGGAGDAPARLATLFDAALADLLARGGLRIERGAEVFGGDGVAGTGDVLRIGEVAAAEWGGGYRPLVRTLDGSTRVVAGLRGGAATTGAGQSIEVVLFDPREPPAPGQYVSRSAWGKLQAGGLLMWPLLVLAAVMLLVALERLLALGLLAGRVKALVAALGGWSPPELGAGHVPDNVDAKHWLSAPAVSVIKGANHPRAELEERATEALLRVRPRMTRRLSVLSMTAAAAPLIGLLGTVTGMITTFSVITEHGTGDPQLLSGGISEALLTTQLGLAVAIPALLMHAGLSRWASRLADANQNLVFDLVHAAHPPKNDVRAESDGHDSELKG